MTSRERVLCAMDHREPDVVPIDLNGHASSGMMVQAYHALRAHLGLPSGTLYIYDFIQQLAIIEEDVLERVGADVVPVWYDFRHDPGYWQDFTLHDGTSCKIPAYIDVEKTPEGYIVRGDDGQPICIQKRNCLYFEQMYFPLMAKEPTDDDPFDNLPYVLSQTMWCRLGPPPAPAGFDEAGLVVRSETARRLRKNTTRAVYATFGGNLLEIGEFAFRMDHFLYELAASPARIHRFLDRLTEQHLANLDRFLDAVGDHVDIIGFGDDLGSQNGPLISPRMYREFFKPRHALLWGHVKKRKPHLRLSLHCCGDVYALLPDLCEAGLEAINPVQLTCRGMELSRLKREFGKDITFWGGGCDTRNVLPTGTPQEVSEHTRRNVEIMSRGGGYVFQQVHNIMADVPPQNVMVMFDAVRRG